MIQKIKERKKISSGLSLRVDYKKWSKTENKKGSKNIEKKEERTNSDLQVKNTIEKGPKRTDNWVG